MDVYIKSKSLGKFSMASVLIAAIVFTTFGYSSTAFAINVNCNTDIDYFTGICLGRTPCPVIIQGTSRPDTIVGSACNDIINGNGGDDEIAGLHGADAILGGTEDDEIAGGAGPDAILGGSGDDAIAGGLGNDNLRGNAGVDVIYGGIGDDTINGEANSDGINCGQGTNDRVDGFVNTPGPNRDIFVDVNGNPVPGATIQARAAAAGCEHVPVIGLP